MLTRNATIPMQSMDYETLFTVLVSVFLIQAVALSLTWRQNPEEIGIRDWAVAAIAISVGSFVSVMAMEMDGSVYGPDTLRASGILRAFGAACGATGWYFVWIGIRHFYGKCTLSYRYAAVFLLLFTLLMLFTPASIAFSDWRIFWVSMVIALFAAMSTYEFLQCKPFQNLVTLLMVATLVVTSLAWFLRMLAHTNVLDDTPLYDAWSMYIAIIAGVTLTVSMIILTNERINQKLHDQATRDSLTGALNRRAFIAASAPYISALRRKERNLAVVVLDIDHFKKINDQYGHALGDQILQEFVSLAHTTLRDSDLFARYGGEEFVILLHDTNHIQAAHVMQRLSETYAGQAIHAGNELISVTFSAGVCCAVGPVQVDLETMLEAADHAMYKAKEAGRNRIEFSPDGIGMGDLELL
jgi:diguanylate cyclase (GGDEF)-like protein